MDVILQQFFDFGVMKDHFDALMQGFWQTILLSLIGGGCALAWGLVLALLRQLPGRGFAPVRGLVIAYVDVFRGIPFLLVLLLLYTSLGALAVKGQIPDFIGHPAFFGKEPNFWIGIYGLTITYGAYMAEVYRAGIESVHPSQEAAARSLGLSHPQTLRYVIVPQAVRRVIPPLLNDFIALQKDTALVAIIGVGIEMTRAAQIYGFNAFNYTSFVVAACFYVLLTVPLSRYADWMAERQRRRSQASSGAL